MTDEAMVSLGDILDALEEDNPRDRRLAEIKQQIENDADKATPLYVHDAERCIIGAALLDPERVLVDVEEVGLHESDFHLDRHRKVFRCMLRMWGEQKEIDTLSVTDELMRLGELGSVGGAQEIARLEALLPTTAAAKHHARMVIDKSALRQIHKVCGEAQVRARRGDSPHDVVDMMIEEASKVDRTRGLAPFVNISDAVRAALDRMPILGGEEKGLKTGFVDVDRLILLRSGELCIVAARPSMGKTQFVLDVSKYFVLGLQKRVMIFSLEMPADQLMTRMIASEAGVDTRKPRAPQNEINRITYASAKYADAGERLCINDAGAHTIGEIRSVCRREHARRPIDLIVVDYLQLVDASTKSDNRSEDVGEVSRGLKKLARELDVPVVALSQLNRGVEARSDKRPMMSDLRESGSIEQDADVIAFLFRPEYYMGRATPDELKGKAEFIVSKQRNGPTGSAHLRWRAECTRFENIAEE